MCLFDLKSFNLLGMIWTNSWEVFTIESAIFTFIEHHTILYLPKYGTYGPPQANVKIFMALPLFKYYLIKQ